MKTRSRDDDPLDLVDQATLLLLCMSLQQRERFLATAATLKHAPEPEQEEPS